MTTEALLDEFATTVNAALAAAAVYDIGRYGWLNENDADPEFIGHAMWQVDQPLARSLEDVWGEHPVRERPSPRDKAVIVAGEDFCGMMRLARLSIGLAFLWRQHRPGNPVDEQPYLALHYTDAILNLAIASDRLREVLIVACTGDTVDAYESQTKRNRWYVTPFEQAEPLLAARGALHANAHASLAALPALAAQLYAQIEHRNRLTHEVATRLGHLTQTQTEALERRYDREQRAGHVAPTSMPDIPQYEQALAAYNAELDDKVRSIVEWYTLLVRASNYVFQIEYWSRVKPAIP